MPVQHYMIQLTVSVRTYMTLSQINIKSVYFSPQDDVIRDFFIPVLQNSTHYDRATGYFSSSSLIELSVGICELARNKGTIRIITSPHLTEEDVLAIRAGYDRREKIRESLIRDFDPPDDPASMDRLSLISYLISEGIMEIKISVMRNIEEYPNALFHAKFGTMRDDDGFMVAFNGSMNESKNGFGGNWEMVNAATSESNKDLCDCLQWKFDELWSDCDESTCVLEMTDVFEMLLSKYDTGEARFDLDKELVYWIHKNRESVYFKSPKEFKMRPYQSDAVDAWASNGYRGIFNMATGTGKTKTALCALEKLYNDHPDEPIFSIIIAPQKHLVDQWAEEIRNFDVIPIIGHSDSNLDSWKETFKRKVKLFRSKPTNQCLVITVASFSMQDVQEWIGRIDRLAIVADEAHNLGSVSRLKKLPEHAEYRLALSATIERYNDSSGTSKLKDYFGEECIHLSLDQAIGKYLTNYNYYPIVCHYNCEEYNKLIDSNVKLDSILRSSVPEKVKKAARKEYLQYSYTLNASMESKFDRLQSLMSQFIGDDHFLVYSGKVRINEEGQSDDADYEVMEHAIDRTVKILGMNGLGMKISRITYRENAQERKAIIDEFNDGGVDGIVAISCLDEGVDIPSIRTAVIMSSSNNPREYIQRRGRVLRLYPGKDHADIYDFIVIPKNLNDVDPNDIHVEIELKVIAKELRRIVEFSRVCLNPDTTNELLDDISASYKLNIDYILKEYGEMTDERYR